MSHASDSIAETGKAVAKLSDPRVFPGAMAVLMVIAIGILLMWQRQDMREEREGFLSSLRENTAAVRELSGVVRDLQRTFDSEHRR